MVQGGAVEEKWGMKKEDRGEEGGKLLVVCKVK